MKILTAFGEHVDAHGSLAIKPGGFIVPRDDSAVLHHGEQEQDSNERSSGKGSGQKTGSTAGAWKGPSTETTEGCKGPHTLRQLDRDGFLGNEVDELADYFPDVKVAASSSTCQILSLTFGLFESQPIRARLFLEVPRLVGRTQLVVGQKYASLYGETGTRKGFRILIPQIRAWAFSANGAFLGLPITSHHQYSDGSMCVCMPFQWIRGRDLIIDYVNFCVCWVAKALHEDVIGHYPGLQHLPAHIRRHRDRALEFCGCGSRRRYAECCRKSDRLFSDTELLEHRLASDRLYKSELAWQRRFIHPLSHFISESAIGMLMKTD